MIKALKIIIAAFLIFALHPSAGQAAPAAELPEGFAGRYWAMMSCEYAEQYIYATPYHMLSLDRTGPRLEKVESAEQRGLYYILRTHRGAYLIKPGDEERFQYYMLPALPHELDLDFDSDFAQRPDIITIEFRACGPVETQDQAWVSNVISETDLALFYKLQTLAERCGEGQSGVFADNRQCHEHLFEILSRSGDAALDYHDLAALWQSVLYLVAAVSCDFPAIDSLARNDEEARVFALQVLDGADQNKDGLVTIDELRARWAVLHALPQTRRFLQEVASLHVIMPFLPAAPLHDSCLRCMVDPAEMPQP